MSEHSIRTLKCNPVPRFLIKRNLKVVKKSDIITGNLYKEDVLYDHSTAGDFLKDNTKITVTNKLNLLTKNSVTVARYEDEPGLEKTSENITRLIGQTNYDTLFSALCSVISYELKIRGILSLLTVPKKVVTTSVQTEQRGCDQKFHADKSCQTDETYLGMYIKEKTRKRLRRQQLTPYVVTDAPKQNIQTVKKVVIFPDSLKNSDMPVQTDASSTQSTVFDYQLTELHFDEDSNHSLGKMSSITANSVPELYTNPLGMLDNYIDKVTKVQNVTEPLADWSNATTVRLLDGSIINIPFKVEDHFHIATPDIMKYVMPEQRKKLFWYQAYIDLKYCLSRNEDNYLPIHEAAKNGDLNLLRRQCSVLNTRHESVDIPTCENESALQISIYGDNAACTAMLLQFGADALVTDEEYRNCFHLAAENHPDHLRAMVKHCHEDPMKILQENEELWKPELASKPKEYLSRYLLGKISTMFDNDGNTPLMVACKLANFENVDTLIAAAPDTINIQNPNSGNTALYLTVAAACLDSNHRGNKSKISDEFKKTIELLIENGADPSIDNHAGTNVNTVLTDLNIGECSMLIANKMTSRNCFEGVIPSTSKACNAFMLIKGDDGKLDVKDITKHEDRKPKEETVKNVDNSPVILENIKIEKDSPVLKRFKKERAVIALSGKKLHFDAKTKEISLKPVTVKKEGNVESNYMNTFKSFVENVTGSKIRTAVAIADANISTPGKPKIIVDMTSATKELTVTLKTTTGDCSKDNANVSPKQGAVMFSNDVTKFSEAKDKILIDSKLDKAAKPNPQSQKLHRIQTSGVSNSSNNINRASTLIKTQDHPKKCINNIKRRLDNTSDPPKVDLNDAPENFATESISKKRPCL